jgi:hypothetical protein
VRTRGRRRAPERRLGECACKRDGGRVIGLWSEPTARDRRHALGSRLRCSVSAIWARARPVRLRVLDGHRGAGGELLGELEVAPAERALTPT